MPRFAYFYFNRNAPDRIGPVVPAHVKYWHAAGLEEYEGGPFGDRSGGLISFAAPSLEAADALVKLAFRRSPDGDEAVLAEMRTLLSGYLHQQVGSRGAPAEP